MKKKKGGAGARNQARGEDLLKTSHALVKERSLGPKPGLCRVCGAEGLFQSYRVKEMMIPTRDEFEYFACGSCSCLQIRDIPADMGAYYRSDYYSYEQPALSYLPPGTAPHPTRILDVGCGAGAWLCAQPAAGFSQLFGCDPFIEKDIKYDNGVIIKKASIHEMTGTFDHIQLSHSFEHMADPHEVMAAIKRLLAPQGLCQISIPVFPNIAFAIYGPFWYQIDAPRHIFLHSKLSLVYLANGAGLDVAGVTYNSNNGQFMRSRLYQLDVPFFEQSLEVRRAKFTAEDVAKMDKMAGIANAEHTGDMAVFELKHL